MCEELYKICANCFYKILSFLFHFLGKQCTIRIVFKHGQLTLNNWSETIYEGQALKGNACYRENEWKRQTLRNTKLRPDHILHITDRSEERRVGKECM